MELKFIYLVISSFGITCCESLDIAKDVLSSELAFDDSASIQKKILFTKEVY